MFDGFELDFIELPEASFRVRHGGNGPPVLLLHGHPRTHATWNRVAPLLADHHTVVCPDLPGFGQSSIPADAPDHGLSSKRVKARHCVALMRRLGHERFAVVGHDRGSYTAFRMAMDNPSVITRLVVLDGVPIAEALDRCGEEFARRWWHWFFYAQPEKPERAILADPLGWYGGSPEQMGAEAYADFAAAVQEPSVIHGMLEDYRAGLTVDRHHDAEDRRLGRRVECPTLVMWSRRDDLEALYGDVLGVWRPWTTTLSGRAIDSGHQMAEDAPDALAAELLRFLSGAPADRQ